MGTFKVELYPKQAPKTCRNFTELYATFEALVAPPMAQTLTTQHDARGTPRTRPVLTRVMR